MQKNLRLIVSKDVIFRRLQPRERLGAVYMQPVTWIGSRRNAKGYSDLMTICGFQGNPALYMRISFRNNIIHSYAQAIVFVLVLYYENNIKKFRRYSRTI